MTQDAPAWGSQSTCRGAWPPAHPGQSSRQRHLFWAPSVEVDQLRAPSTRKAAYRSASLRVRRGKSCRPCRRANAGSGRQDRESPPSPFERVANEPQDRYPSAEALRQDIGVSRKDVVSVPSPRNVREMPGRWSSATKGASGRQLHALCGGRDPWLSFGAILNAMLKLFSRTRCILELENRTARARSTSGTLLVGMRSGLRRGAFDYG